MSDVMVIDDGKCEICGQASNEDQILLCDKCDGEFHMFCLQPKLIEVPEGEWLCPLCHELGSSLYLQESIDTITDSRKKRRTGSGVNGEYIDESDKDVYSEFKFLPLDTNCVGMVVRLYSFVDSCYHSGRILGQRNEETMDEVSRHILENDDYTQINKKPIQHLVLFKKGMNGRNSSVLQWLHLPDFACILCSDVVFIKLQGSGVWPAQRCYRSYWELLRQSLTSLISSSNSNSNNSKNNSKTNSSVSKQQMKGSKKRNKEKAIVQLKQAFGTESYIYVFGDESYMNIPRKHEQTLLINYVTKSKLIKSFQGKRFSISCALASVEMEEQQDTQRAATLLSIQALEASVGGGTGTVGGYDLKTWRQIVDAASAYEQLQSSPLTSSSNDAAIIDTSSSSSSNINGSSSTKGNKRGLESAISTTTISTINEKSGSNNNNKNHDDNDVDKNIVSLFATITSSSSAAAAANGNNTSAIPFFIGNEAEEKTENGNGYLLSKKHGLLVKSNLHELDLFKKRLFSNAVVLPQPTSTSSSSSTMLLSTAVTMNMDDVDRMQNDTLDNNNDNDNNNNALFITGGPEEQTMMIMMMDSMNSCVPATTPTMTVISATDSVTTTSSSSRFLSNAVHLDLPELSIEEQVEDVLLLIVDKIVGSTNDIHTVNDQLNE